MALDFLTDAESFSQDDAAQFSIGNTDIVGYWYSMQPCTDGSTISGLCFPVGRKDFDEAMLRLNANRAAQNKQPIFCVTVIHDSSNQYNKPGNAESNEKEYWLFEAADLFVIARGMREPFAEQGIVYCWKYVKKPNQAPKLDAQGKPKPNMSSLRFRAFMPELLEAGYLEPIQVSASSTKAGAFLKCLKTQQRVLIDFKALTGKGNLPFWAFSLPLGKSKVIQVIPADGGRGKNMVYPECKAPEKLPESYFAQHYVTKTSLGEGLKDIIRAAMEPTIEWARSTTADILKEAASDMPIAEEAPLPDEGYEPEVSPANDELANEGQRKALRSLGNRFSKPDLLALAEKPDLTFKEASTAISSPQRKA